MYHKLGQACVTDWDSFIITIWGKCCYKLGVANTNQGNRYYKTGQLLQNWSKIYYNLGKVLQIREIITNCGISPTYI